MENAHGVDTPVNVSVKFSSKLTPQTKEEQQKMERIPYRQLVGCLIYALLTRPDCSVAVGELARFMNNPGMTSVEVPQVHEKHEVALQLQIALQEKKDDKIIRRLIAC